MLGPPPPGPLRVWPGGPFGGRNGVANGRATGGRRPQGLMERGARGHGEHRGMCPADERHRRRQQRRRGRCRRRCGRGRRRLTVRELGRGPGELRR
ncbi:MAG: hypothetical protein CVU56_10860 [Deltaproteobacteria bacterium HGW-Deltaproteobacteria-14]|nr:MAG: hypothetical protein CVU56_10860 [Deltaproteobacteria bacterium HGW-Deltaproteobacteria-14]